MAMARAYEQRSTVLSAIASGARQHRPPPRTNVPALSPTAQAPGPTAPNPFKKLSPTEILERRQKGRCFNCDEPYSRGHKCQKLFYLEVLDEVDEIPAVEPQQDSEEPLISPHAITGVRNERMLQIGVQVAA
jgi:hypothetical protein